MRAAAGKLHFKDGDGRPFGLATSIGLATRSDADASSEALLERADRALYRDKQSGRNRVCEADDDVA